MRISDWSSDVCSSDLRGLADRILNLAAGHAAGDWTMAFAAALDHTLSFKALGDLGPERPVMLIGPSGAGKTVTAAKLCACARLAERSEEHTSELQSIMRISYAVFCFKKKIIIYSSLFFTIYTLILLLLLLYLLFFHFYLFI